MLDRSHGDRTTQRWALPIALASAASGFELAGDSTRLALRYERSSVLAGELWRLVSGNLVHLGWRHLVLNLIGLALVIALGGRILVGVHGAIVMLGSMLGVGAGLLLFAPTVGWYVGMSGALHGMLAAVVVESAMDSGMRRWGIACGALLALKLGWEQLAGPLPLTAAAAGGPVIVAAHLYGAVAGAMVAIMLVRRDLRRARAATRV